MNWEAGMQEKSHCRSNRWHQWAHSNALRQSLEKPHKRDKETKIYEKHRGEHKWVCLHRIIFGTCNNISTAAFEMRTQESISPISCMSVFVCVFYVLTWLRLAGTAAVWGAERAPSSPGTDGSRLSLVRHLSLSLTYSGYAWVDTQ